MARLKEVFCASCKNPSPLPEMPIGSCGKPPLAPEVLCRSFLYIPERINRLILSTTAPGSPWDCAERLFLSRFLQPMNRPEANASSEVTRILNLMREGGAHAGNELMGAIYAELRKIARAKMAREQPGHTLQATALVHEAWLRLGSQSFENRAHFFAAAAEAMRRILVDRARRGNRVKRGGGAEHVDLADLDIAAPVVGGEELLAVHEALEQLAAEDPRKAELVKLRYFAGLSFEETADVLGISVATAKRDWAYARAWLHHAISTG